MSDELIATIVKNTNEEIHVSRGEFKGHALISVRVFFRSESGEMLATKKGIAVKPGLVPDIIAALKASLAEPSE